jgi:hypothetical protein
VVLLSTPHDSSVIDIIIRKNLSGITAELFDDFWEVLIYGIKLKTVSMTPIDCLIQLVSNSTGPQDNLMAFFLSIDEVPDKIHIRTSDVRPSILTQSAVKINSINKRLAHFFSPFVQPPNLPAKYANMMHPNEIQFLGSLIPISALASTIALINITRK